MKQLLPVLLFFIILSIKAQQAPGLNYNSMKHYQSNRFTDVEKLSQFGIFGQYPLQIGSAYIYPGLSPMDIYIPLPQIIPSDFQLLLFTIQNASFDNQKMMIASQFIEENGAYSLQLFEILSLLSFDNNKLDLAISAYPYIIDKEYFLVVINTLELISSRNELMEFAKRH